MKQKLIYFILFFCVGLNIKSQVFKPAKWATSVEKISETEYNLIAKATIDSGWHLYSQNIPEDGPIATAFTFTTNKNYFLIGLVEEENGQTLDDQVFKMKIKFFEDSATFTQKIKVTNNTLTNVKGEVEFMVCDESKCLPPTYVALDFNLQNAKEINSNFLNDSSLSTNNNSQLLDPVKWNTTVEKLSDTEYILISSAKIENKWHLYSQKESEEEGPIETDFDYNLPKNVKLIGTTIEGKGITLMDPVFEMEITYFENSAVFKQKIEVSDKNISTILAEVSYMACDETQCTAPTYKDLVFDLKNTTKAKEDFVVTTTKNKKNENKGLLSIFFIAFLSGFAALLTPCVFPMIPMTVSFFTKQSKTKAKGIKNAIIYGLSIIIIYVLLGVLVSLLFGADALNALSTNVWFNVLFFILLLVFAASFLGAFEIMLPNSWANKVDSQADKGGLIGIFFMALALAIVSFSCTGPIVGTLLVEAASGGSQIGPIIGMLGFSLAIALPFALFAAFPGWLNSLPKSGGWLNTVKVVLGFLELALAFKFLSNADLVLQLHWLEREVFIAIWIAIFGTLALYLFGKIQLPHDSPLKHISVGRLSLGMLSLMFTLYMLPGLWGAPLNLISAFPPPQHYSESPYGVGFMKLGTGGAANIHIPEGAHLMAPHNILAFNDYDKGLAYAKEVGKPVMIDFTGHACVNCRKMEQKVWVQKKILKMLKEDVVLISLYVDDKRKLKESEITGSKLRPGKKLKYIGQKWSELQTLKYKTNTQPFYVLMHPDGVDLNVPVGYTPNAEEYYNWMKEGIGNFKK